jgi:hypothetical protein
MMGLPENVEFKRKTMLAVRFYAIVFIIFYCTLSYAETAMSKSEIRGVYLGLGVACPQFMIDSGEQVSLMGERLGELTAGNRFRLTGIIARASKCMQGKTFIVSTFVVEKIETDK